MIPAYVLHHPSCHERTEIVKDIVDKTKATVFESYLLPNGKDGCRWSHIGVAKLAKSLHPEKSYLVFEDDCALEEGWQEGLKGVEFADVVYLGYTDRTKDTLFGTHALYISPKARDVIIEHTEEHKNEVPDKGAYDFILSLLCRRYGLITCMPRFSDKDKYCSQKKGLRSQITGRIRD
jgi:GR25 family glycosyltransferase involved in LPS biosynthesis